MRQCIKLANVLLAALVVTLAGALVGALAARALASTPGNCPQVITGTCPAGTVLLQGNRYGFECATSGTQGCCLYDAYNADCIGDQGQVVAHTIIEILRDIYPDATCKASGVCSTP